MEGIMGGKVETVFRNMYKGHMDKTKGVGSGEGGGDGSGGRKCRQLYLDNNKKKKNHIAQWLLYWAAQIKNIPIITECFIG